MEVDSYLNGKIVSWFSGTDFYDRIAELQTYIQNCDHLSLIQQLNFKLELLLTGLRYQDDSKDVQEKFGRRLDEIVSKIRDSKVSSPGMGWPSAGSCSSLSTIKLPSDFEIDETDPNETVVESSLPSLRTPSRHEFSDLESIGSYGIGETRPIGIEVGFRDMIDSADGSRRRSRAATVSPSSGMSTSRRSEVISPSFRRDKKKRRYRR